MKMFRDTWLLFTWSVRATLRSPVWAIIGLFQPLCYLFLFGPLLQPLSHIPGFPPGGAQTVFTPGVMVMMSVFGTAFAGFGLITELQSGFIEQLCITPDDTLPFEWQSCAYRFHAGEVCTHPLNKAIPASKASDPPQS